MVEKFLMGTLLMKTVNLIRFVSLPIVVMLFCTSNIVFAKNVPIDLGITYPSVPRLTYEDNFLKADEAFVMNVDKQNNTLIINFEIAPDYYLYRHQFKFNGNLLTSSTVKLPVGAMVQDEYFGAQEVYKKQLSFSIDIERSSPNATVDITYQGCAAKGLCYPPTTKTVAVNKVKMKDKLD